eukprot:10426839-Ditylum_brightwellii.AAC.1
MAAPGAVAVVGGTTMEPWSMLEVADRVERTTPATIVLCSRSARGPCPRYDKLNFLLPLEAERGALL